MKVDVSTLKKLAVQLDLAISRLEAGETVTITISAENGIQTSGGRYTEFIQLLEQKPIDLWAKDGKKFCSERLFNSFSEKIRHSCQSCNITTMYQFVSENSERSILKWRNVGKGRKWIILNWLESHGLKLSMIFPPEVVLHFKHKGIVARF